MKEKKNFSEKTMEKYKIFEHFQYTAIFNTAHGIKIRLKKKKQTNKTVFKRQFYLFPEEKKTERFISFSWLKFSLNKEEKKLMKTIV